MKVTIRDIAREAGVSPATVSNVFNGKNKISDKTRELVLSIARERGYAGVAGMSPDKRTLRFIIFKRHGKVIMDTPFFSELISSIETACRAHQYELLVTYMDASDPNVRSQAADVVKNGNQGILLLATEMNDENLRMFKIDIRIDCKLPLLVLDSLFLWDDHNAVVINNREAGYLAAEHFIACGHRSFALVTSSFPFNNMGDRRDGFTACLKKHGYALREEDIFFVEPTMEGAAHDMLALLDKRTAPLPTALFASNDIMAVGVSRALKQRGVRAAGRHIHHRHGRSAHLRHRQPAADHAGRAQEPAGHDGREPPDRHDRAARQHRVQNLPGCGTGRARERKGVARKGHGRGLRQRGRGQKKTQGPPLIFHGSGRPLRFGLCRQCQQTLKSVCRQAASSSAIRAP